MQRALLLVIMGFWITMNALLIRSEFGPGRETGGDVPLAVVWKKILAAPDDSSLAILRNGTRIGHVRWVPNVGEELATGKRSSSEFMPEGSVETLKEYRIDVEGNVAPFTTSRVRFAANAIFATNHSWKEFEVRAGNRPSSWTVKGSAETGKVRIQHDSFDRKEWDQTLDLAMLKRPDLLLGALGMAEGNPLLMQQLQLPNGTRIDPSALKASGASILESFHWKSGHDWLRLGHSKIRVYHLEAKLGEGLRMEAWISMAGELLRISIPGGIVLVNEAIENLPAA